MIGIANPLAHGPRPGGFIGPGYRFPTGIGDQSTLQATLGLFRLALAFGPAGPGLLPCLALGRDAGDVGFTLLAPVITVACGSDLPALRGGTWRTYFHSGYSRPFPAARPVLANEIRQLSLFNLL